MVSEAGAAVSGTSISRCSIIMSSQCLSVFAFSVLALIFVMF